MECNKNSSNFVKYDIRQFFTFAKQTNYLHRRKLMIEVSNVSRNFGTFRAVNDVSFSIPTGQIVGLLGPNGAGKTTTMRMITGFLAPTEGKILIDGIDVAENPVETKKKIGYMPESAPLYGEMIVEDYLKYVAQIHGENPDERIPHLCEECGLKEIMDKNISELSRGNRQRVALAHALMANPEILILDEPTSGLDPNQVEDVRNIIRENKHSRLPVYLNTPDNIVGILDIRTYIRETLADDKKVRLHQLLRKALRVPGTKRIDDLLDEMTQSRTHMCAVADDSGHVLGIITVEDILEELVGEIMDEDDVGQPDAIESALGGEKA
jgi:ABC-type Na+ transport system ATPase subunit NatA